MNFNLSLSDQVQKMGLGDHVCLIYKDENEQMAAIVPYLKQGLERNEFCVYIADDLTVQDVMIALSKGGINVEAEEECGRLVFATKREVYLKSGEFDPHAMMAFLKSSMEEAVKNGFSGFRATGEMTWALGNECGCQRLIEYEDLLNNFFPGSKATAICQYNITRFKPEVIRDVLRTHPIAIIDGKVCSNLYYEDPKIVLGEQSAAQKVNWMMDQLKHFHEIQENLEIAVTTRDDFLSIASHELKTPLTSLKLQAQSLNKIISAKDSLEDPFVQRVHKAMSSTERQVDRLSKLVNDLLDVSQINAGKLRVKRETVKVPELAEYVRERFAQQAASAGVQISFDIQPGLEGEWDRFRMEQVFSNLLSNALKYGKGNPVSFKAVRENNSAVIHIQDKGIGIAGECQERIFNRFERAINANEVSGLGLGLYISKEIIEAHGGRISVDSSPGMGATFKVQMPLSAEGQESDSFEARRSPCHVNPYS